MAVLTICSYKRKSMKLNVKSQDKKKRSRSLKLLWLVDLGIRMLELQQELQGFKLIAGMSSSLLLFSALFFPLSCFSFPFLSTGLLSKLSYTRMELT
jgi:hypothetical protein